MPDYVAIANQAADQYGVPENIFAALIQSESGFNPNPGPYGSPYAFGNSRYGGGIAQFTPSTAAQYGVDRLDPTSSLFGAAHYISDLFQRFGDWTKAVLSYKGAYSPTNQALFGRSGNDLLTPELQAALNAPGNPTTISGENSEVYVAQKMGSQLTPDRSASTSQSGCTGWLTTPVACITATLEELGLILLALIVLAVGLWMLAERN